MANRRGVLVILLICSNLYSQQKETPGTYLRVTSSLVLVDFVAVDKNGRVVTDLKREEMVVLEDGRKQTIESFYAPGSAPGPAFLSPDKAVGGSSTRGKRQPSQTVIVIDSRCIDSNNFVQTVSAIRGFIDRHLAADHALMITEIYRGLRVLSPLTRDRTALLAALDQLKPQTVYNPLDARRASIGSAEAYLDELQLQITYLGEGLKSLCHSLAGPGGRKHVVFFSEGYPINPKQLVEMNARQAVADSKETAVRQAASNAVGALKDPGVLSMVREVVSVANTYGISFY